MVRITKTFLQYKSGLGPKTHESDLNIEVEYDKRENEVTQIIKVWSYSYKHRTVTDLTAIFAEQLSTQLDEIISSIDWWEQYCSKRDEVAA
jgi:hypothetical protein